MSQIFSNLLNNSAKYTHPGGRIQIEARQIGPTVTISVRDNGVGFDTDQPRLARHGLIGMRYRVEAEGGTMRLDSRPGHGTVIEATLPPEPPAAGTAESIDPVPAAAEA